VQHKWTDVQQPSLESGGRYAAEDIRVRAHEVGPNQTSGIITVSNMLQVHFTSFLPFFNPQRSDVSI
jgi:hypothetical protein